MLLQRMTRKPEELKSLHFFTWALTNFHDAYYVGKLS